MINMPRLRGRVPLTIISLIIFTLLIITYHILGNDVDDISSKKISRHRNVENAYSLNDFMQNPENIAGQQQLEAHVMGHKIVHLDLKGAPPKLNYYEYLFPLLRKLGATGILIEYEDMFPFEGEIQNISARNCYSKQDIITIQKIARDNKLVVIPLVQTFGHLEFVLKLDKYKAFREVLRYPQVLCPSNNKTLPLLYDMIDQIISAHPDIKYLHIGADEVYYLGECFKCVDEMFMHRWDKKQLFLAHVSRVAKRIKEKYPELTILMWDDEFRDILPQAILDVGLNKLVEPVVWKYTTDLDTTLTDVIWDNYALVWSEIWIATAFKGATAPDRYYTDISYHLKNHICWLEIVNKYSHKINFKGAVLTGWQRYDHFSVLCELLPSAIPSLAINLAVLQSPNTNSFPVEVPKRIMEILKCEDTISLNVPEPQYGWTKCDFNGVLIYVVILRLFLLEQEFNKIEQDSTFKGWLKEYNLKYSYSSPSHVEHAVAELDKHMVEIVSIEKDMRTAMEDIYDIYTIQEWIETFITPLHEKITKLWDVKEKLLERDAWPRRPLTKTDL